MVFILDIDDFKSINDNYEHKMGDEAFKYFVNSVNKCIRESDIMGKFGRDEFIKLPNNISNEESAKSLIERIIKTLKTPLIIDEISISINVSIGISTFPLDAKLTDDLIDKADRAMYKAKKLLLQVMNFLLIHNT